MSNIEKLVLPRWCYHNKKSFRFALSRWKNLKTLVTAHDHNLNGGFEFQAVGENCINLTNLKYLGYLHENNAEQIVRCFPKLKRLNLRCSFLCVRGVLSLITGLQNHVILNLTHCVFYDIDLLCNMYQLLSAQYLVKILYKQLLRSLTNLSNVHTIAASAKVGWRGLH